jgi:hypothetical protein
MTQEKIRELGARLAEDWINGNVSDVMEALEKLHPLTAILVTCSLCKGFDDAQNEIFLGVILRRQQEV